MDIVFHWVKMRHKPSKTDIKYITAIKGSGGIKKCGSIWNAAHVSARNIS